MKTALKNFSKTFLAVLFLIGYIPFNTLAADTDFVITTDTEIQYITGNDFVTVENTYIRKVHNNSYYYPASGEKVFHLPDLPGITEEEISEEREYKKDSLSVTNVYGKDITYSVEELESGNGMYVKIPNYKQTTSSSPYEIIISYQTHDYIQKSQSWVNITAPALPEDLEFEKTEGSTTTSYDYNLDIVVDENISELVKIFPEKYSTETKSNLTHYSFSSTSRLGNSPSIEFGTKQVFKFELEYTTPRTDSLIPEEYTQILKALSTNIYELSLPREFSETNQTVLFEKISPTPTSIARDSEGNIIATFEVPANQESKITVDGYVWVEQDPFNKAEALPEIRYEGYLNTVDENSFLQTYLKPGKYWETEDSLIKQEAERLANYQTDLIELIKTDYQFVNDTLEYDDNKATAENERIGAKAALEGGSAVCMEYADLMIALLRAQGVPARAALGYANLTEESLAEEDQVRHQWVQVWIPDYGWMSVDPTYESSNMKLGGDIDRILWETFNGDSLSNIKVFSADRINSLDSSGYKVKIYSVEEPDTTELLSHTDLVPDTEYESIEDLPISEEYSVLGWFNTFLKATTIGKALVITGPVILLILTVTIVIVFIKLIRARIKGNKKKE